MTRQKTIGVGDWDPSCDFLLTWHPNNLFERRDARPGFDSLLRCKGCRAELTVAGIEKHHKAHVKQRAIEKAEAKAEAMKLAREAAALKRQEAKLNKLAASDSK